jgi:hypothetical protein
VALIDVRSLVGQERVGEDGILIVGRLPDHLDDDVRELLGVLLGVSPGRLLGPFFAVLVVPLADLDLVLGHGVRRGAEAGKDDRATSDRHRLDERTAIHRLPGAIPAYPTHGSLLSALIGGASQISHHRSSLPATRMDQARSSTVSIAQEPSLCMSVPSEHKGRIEWMLIPEIPTLGPARPLISMNPAPFQPLTHVRDTSVAPFTSAPPLGVRPSNVQSG